MFGNLRNTIKELNADVKNVANCKRAKRLRRTLLAVGLPMAILGYAGVIICFILFGNACFHSAFDSTNSFNTHSAINSQTLITFFSAIPCALIAGIGTWVASIGFSIVVTGYTSNLIDETVGNNCKNCGETITAETQFCPKCGTKVRKECSKCHHINNYKNEYCEKCGNKLD